MNAKSFTLLLAAFLALGGGLGGAFVGGIALGKNQEGASAQTNVPAQQSAVQSDAPSPDQLRQQIQSGELSQEEAAQLRQQFQNQDGLGAARQGFAAGDGLTGTIEKIEGNMVTVNTPQGSLQATIESDTIIQRTIEVTLEDLVEGMRLTVIGERGEDGTVEARTILVIPEGEDGLFGGGFFSGNRQRQDQQSP